MYIGYQRSDNGRQAPSDWVALTSGYDGSCSEKSEYADVSYVASLSALHFEGRPTIKSAEKDSELRTKKASQYKHLSQHSSEYIYTQLAANIVMTFDFERLAGLSGFFLELSTSTSASLLSESVLVLPLEWLSSGVRSSSPAAIARIEGAHRSDDHNNASAE